MHSREAAQPTRRQNLTQLADVSLWSGAAWARPLEPQHATNLGEYRASPHLAAFPPKAGFAVGVQFWDRPAAGTRESWETPSSVFVRSLAGRGHRGRPNVHQNQVKYASRHTS